MSHPVLPKLKLELPSSTVGKHCHSESHFKRWGIRNHRLRSCLITPPHTVSLRAASGKSALVPWICVTIGYAIARPNSNSNSIGLLRSITKPTTSPNISRPPIINKSARNMFFIYNRRQKFKIFPPSRRQMCCEGVLMLPVSSTYARHFPRTVYIRWTHTRAGPPISHRYHPLARPMPIARRATRNHTSQNNAII